MSQSASVNDWKNLHLSLTAVDEICSILNRIMTVNTNTSNRHQQIPQISEVNHFLAKKKPYPH